ncbi:cadherin-related family member 1-like [Mya arenaria]|uniref:cadherin-related family member 1-like n=1 Tax=Mya arenaria TaxID=6604 RepID=UPI0022E22CD1|nr:cadherin-related family member 1-like [Mya arenaria]
MQTMKLELSISVICLQIWICMGGGSISYTTPSGGSGTANVDENASGGTVLLDVDVTNNGGTVTFSMANEFLQIHPTSGVITVRNGVVIDYETLPSDKTFTVTFGASDNGGTPLEGTLVVTVNDVNEAPTFAGEELVQKGISVNDKTYENEAVANVRARDPDMKGQKGAIQSYGIQTPNTPFDISDVGSITVANDHFIDITTRVVWSIEVIAVDGGNPSLTGTATFHIGVCKLCSNSGATTPTVGIFGLFLCIAAIFSLWF